MAKVKETVAEKLASELASLKLCPGNESHKYAKTILDLVRKHEDEDMDVTDQIIRDGIDVQEVLKNQKAMMEAIVSLSRLVTQMHDSIKRMEKMSYEGPLITKGDNSGGTESETFTR